VKVVVLYFASLRETLGLAREQLELPDSIATAADLRAHLCARGGVWAKALAQGAAIRVAIDQSVAMPATRLHEGAEVAFFPPVTGG
jgi:molybdopterin synthase sulfur carrier subunit